MKLRRHQHAGGFGEPDRVGGPLGRMPLLALTLLGATLLLGVLLLALPHDPGNAWAGLKDALQDPRVLVPLAALTAVGILACTRAWTYRRLLYLPGPILALPLEAAGTGEDLDDRSWLAPFDLRLRQRLSELRLSAATAAGSAPSFVELLETSMIDPKQPFAAIGRMLALVRPTHAYEVRATLVERQKAPSRGVAMEIVILPQRRTILRTYWKDTWEAALDRAATSVAAEVVPRSRHSDEGVWCSWKGLAIDEGLFDLYQRAQGMRMRHRYDEALSLLYRAVRDDPGNGYLRLALGDMQETLSLYLDALLTYSSIRQPAVRAGRRQKHGAARVELLARYRFTALLGFGERLAEQWLAPPPGPRADASRRSQELSLLRERLRPDLIELFGEHAMAPDDLRRLCVHPELYPDLESGLEALLDERPLLEFQRASGVAQLGREMTNREKHDSRLLRERRLHLCFQLLAEKEVERLLASYSERAIGHLDPGSSVISMQMLPAWAKLRADRARQLLHHEVSGQDRRAGRETEAVAPLEAWPPTPEAIQELWSVKRPLGTTVMARLNRSTAFGDHYDAACTYAVALLRDHQSETSRERVDALTAAAVSELRKAADVGGSAALAARWDWILSEDPDLTGLRGEPAFRRFETEWLPAAQPVAVRPRQIVRLRASRWSIHLCRHLAACVEGVWHARAALEGPTDIHDAIAWWRDEAASWELARELVHHHRHWQTRLKVIESMHCFAERNGTRFRARHPRYMDQPIEGDAVTVDRVAGNEIHFGDLRLNTLADVLGDEPVPGLAEWNRYLLALDKAGGRLQQPERTPLAANRATAWGSLRRVFSEETAGGQRLEDEFRRTIEAQFREVQLGLTICPPPVVSRRFEGPESVVVTELSPPFTV